MDTAMDAAQVLAAKNVVGECLVWDDQNGRLMWVDIIGRRIHALDPATLDHRLCSLDGGPTSIGLRADCGAILDMERHLCAWDWHAKPVPLNEVEPDHPDNRPNEGLIGPDGISCVGTSFGQRGSRGAVL